MLHCVGESWPQGISPVRTVVFSPTPSETFNILQFSEKHNTISKRLRDYDYSSLCLSQIQFDNLIFPLKINQSRLFFPAPAKMVILALTTSGNNYVGLGSRRGGGPPPRRLDSNSRGALTTSAARVLSPLATSQSSNI